jgi:hypothetical protein
MSWVHPKNPAFLVPGYALSKIFRGKFKAGLKKLGLLNQVNPAVWTQKWNVQLQHAGRGEKVLDYLGRYAFRIAISNSRLERFENGEVTFAYRDNQTQQMKHPTLSAFEFMRRFLRHVLPKGFVKVRSYGLWSSRTKLAKVRALLAQESPVAADTTEAAKQSGSQPSSLGPAPALCAHCRTGHMIWMCQLWPQRTRAP